MITDSGIDTIIDTKTEKEKQLDFRLGNKIIN